MYIIIHVRRDCEVTTLRSYLDERGKPKTLVRSNTGLNERSDSTQNYAVIKDLDKEIPIGYGDHAM
jgi:hypothetical protein